ncbi:peptide ABC transporter substrate-binding protein [Halostagnicola sp. A56]|nr:peptide ABC transporter substrate-binding protein [Halostagnicola sp. A56]
MRKRIQSQMNRRTALKTAAGAGVLALAGCLSSDIETEDMRIGAPWEASPDPLDGGSMLRRLGVTEALVGVDYDANPAPELATDWERLDEHRWQFTLREDVTFHDDDSLDAAAAVESLERTLESAAFAALPIEGAEATDDATVVVETETPFSPLPAHLSRNEAVILNPATFDEDGSVAEPVSTGPFAVDSFESAGGLSCTRHAAYYGDEPAIESVRYERVKDDQTRRMKLENGELEMARILPRRAIDALESADGIDVYTPEIPRIRFLTFDTTSAPFDDERVRRAVNYAVDLESLTESVLEGVDDPAVGPFSADVTEWANPDLDGYGHDPEQARRLLSDAGWSAESGQDSVRTRDGQTLEIEIPTFDARSLPLIAEVLQSDLSAVGFDVNVRTIEYNAMLEQVSQGPFDAYLTSWGTLYYPDPDRLAELFHSEEATLHHGYENETVDILLEEARELTDRTARKERYYEIQSIVLEESPVAFLTNYTTVVATASDVNGYEPHPIESRYGLESITVGDE